MGPFRAAIAEYLWMQTYKNKTVLNAQYSNILSASNCSTLTCLRSLSEEALTNAIDASYEVGYPQGFIHMETFTTVPQLTAESSETFLSENSKQEISPRSR